MRKKLWIPLAVGASLCLSVAFLGCKDKSEVTEYVGEYGEAFAVPITGNYIVKNSAGEAVNILDGTFRLSDLKGYVIEVDGKTSAVIKVQDTVAPVIHTGENVFFATLGERVAFQGVLAEDAQKGSFLPQATLSVAGESVPIDLNAFQPTEEGCYEITLTAADDSGNTAEGKIYAEVSAQGNDMADYAARFSRPYGVFQAATVNMSAEYSTEQAYFGEQGALKLVGTGADGKLTLQNLYEGDIGFITGVYLRVYNDSEVAKLLTIEKDWSYNLFPSEWTELYLPSTKLQAVLGEADKSDSDLNGLTLSLPTANGERYYLADVRIEEHMTVYDCFYRWAELVGREDSLLTSEEELKACDELYAIWQDLSPELKESVVRFQYWSFSASDFDDRFGERKLQYLTTATEGFARRADKIIYNDSVFGTKQMLSPDNSIKVSYNSEMSYGKAVHGATEVGSMQLQTGAFDRATVQLQFPLLTADYQTNNIENGVSWYSKMLFYVYSDEGGECVFGTQKKTLTAGAWTKVEFNVDNPALGALKDIPLEFVNVSNSTLYMTSVFVEADAKIKEMARNIQDVMEFLEDTVTPPTPATIGENQKLKSVYEQIRRFSADALALQFELVRMSENTDIPTELAKMYGKLEGILGTPEEGVALDFGNPLGEYQVLTGGSVASYVTRIHHGNEAGSLQLARAEGEVWSYSFKPYFPTEITPEEGKKIASYTFYVYAEATAGKTITVASSEQGVLGTLQAGAWVEITLDAEHFADGVYMMCNNWNDEIPSTLRVFLSSVRANFEDIGEEVQ